MSAFIFLKYGIVKLLQTSYIFLNAKKVDIPEKYSTSDCNFHFDQVLCGI